MWLILFVILGIAAVIFGWLKIEAEDYRGLLPLGLGVFIVVISITGDPLNMVRVGLRDNNEVASDGTANYWYNLNTGDKYHVKDPEVVACANVAEIEQAGGVDIQTCSIFGGGAGKLYRGGGAIQEIADVMANVRSNGGGRPNLIWPGQPMVVDGAKNDMNRPRFGCMFLYSPDINTNYRPGASGLRYRLKTNGQWGEYFLRPLQLDGPRVYYAQAVEASSPDDLPRPMMVAWQEHRFLQGSTDKNTFYFCLQR